ncbi:arsenosugar biosynthesis-associated peroxidase-like protein [Amycolatopsis minnesotensis]|uniref:Carboxymuconolactone decarboxylase-like domain-containing protein n=1 Tax=Amycolatopsis minnesotensis TaxID=337894 RepID=A0ABN2QKM6_9PSEU
MTLSQEAGRLDRDRFDEALAFFTGLDLLTVVEAAEVRAMFEPGFPYALAMAAADSVHVHVKVPDVDALPHERIRAEGVEPVAETDGYVKYPFPGGINMIFSSIPISEDDMLPGAEAPSRAVLDHKGVDLRGETGDVREIFDGVPGAAAENGWRHVPQGGDGDPVYCCHTEVSGKHWVFPGGNTAGQRRPIEFAYGGLVLHDAKMGCDLRPIDPADPRAEEARAALSACAAGHTEAEPGTSYYEPADLGKFAEVGTHATVHMQRFWAYYNGVFGEGALTAREKALIGLAVAHTHQCPYCIDSFTNSCVNHGVTPDQVHEAIHASAALAAGVHLVHGVQTRKVLQRRNVI